MTVKNERRDGNNETSEDSMISPPSIEAHSEPGSHEDQMIQECHCCCCCGSGGDCGGKVDRELLPAKLFYFFFFAANGSLIPYLILFFKQLQLTPSQVGIVSGLKPFISFLFSPIWGYVADKSRRGKIVYVISLFAYLGGYVAYSFAPAKNVCSSRNNMSSINHHPYMFHIHKRTTLTNEVQSLYTMFSTFNKVKKNVSNSTVAIVNKKDMISNHLGENITTAKKIIGAYDNVTYTDRTTRINYFFTDLTPGLMGETLFHMPTNAFASEAFTEYLPHLQIDAETDNEDTRKLIETPSTERLVKSWSGAVHSSNSPWTVCAAAKANTVDDVANLAQLNDDTNNSNSNDNDNVLKTFYYLLIVTIAATLFSCPLITLIDAATIRKLKETDNTHKYGNQRLWGSLGWGITAFSVGAILSVLPLCPGVNKEVNYYPAFYIFAGLLTCAFVVGFKLQFNDADTESEFCVRNDQPSLASRAQRIKEGLILMKEPAYCSFIVTSFYIGVTMSIIKTFLFWHLKDIGGTQILFSIIAGVNCFAEVSVYYFSSILIKRLGHVGVLYVALLCYSLRLFYYGLLTNPWYVLAAEPLSGITTAAAWATMTSYVGVNASPGSGTTMQGILHGVHWGLGHGCGELIGGFMVSNLGAPQTFNIFGALTLLHLLIFWLINNYSNRKKAPYEELANDDEISADEYGDKGDEVGVLNENVKSKSP